jgi:photosystem II stability/assembly factor-like uncharacterized protein
MVENIQQDIVYALAASPDFAHDKRCFAARQSGLWRSDDGGIEWQLLGNLPGAATPVLASAVAVSPHFQFDATVFAGVPGGVMWSIDGGDTWAVNPMASPPPFVSALAISPNYELDGTVFAATLEDGVFRSENRGITWKAWNFGLFDVNILSMAISQAFIQDKTVYVGTETGIFFSANGGHAWRETGFPTDFAPVLSLALSPQFARDGILFAGTESSGVFYSDNRGQTWQQILECGTVNAVLLAHTFPETPDMLVLSNDTLWRSGDGGKSWANWKPDEKVDADFTAAVAPDGVAQESKLLLGLSNGQILALDDAMHHFKI